MCNKKPNHLAVLSEEGLRSNLEYFSGEYEAYMAKAAYFEEKKEEILQEMAARGISP